MFELLMAAEQAVKLAKSPKIQVVIDEIVNDGVPAATKGVPQLKVLPILEHHSHIHQDLSLKEDTNDYVTKGGSSNR